MVTGVARSCYTAPCRWYANGPVGAIRYYFAKPGALFLPLKTCFHPYSQILQYSNTSLQGEITGRGLRKWDRGENVNDLAGTHYEGTPADFLGEGMPPE